ncbi:GntR family transcriptional regulator [Erythrobacter sp. BLCC-B19]|uniref:GntR family transcriptional regulator n=1 Tax=Erythrobacter sp. BLCC-B19 TaxID=3025315 RepID=UPI002361D13C|nr:GntR family transcriptional regulator [Erythrobacter sp. BLCC-B19]WDA41346.1 GntR family transcriptional regulator [Erythrobacter sp. BLCC-B19]
MATEATEAKTQRLPRYLQLAGELREAILKGEFAGGRQFPTETVLCARYDVSRYTIREALRRLEAEGLIQRRRGSGTTVQPAAARGGALHQPLSNVGELLQYARDSEVVYERQGHGPLPAEVAVQLAEPTGGEWTVFRGVRRHAGDAPPIAATAAYFHEMLGEAVDALDLGAGTLFSQIEQLAGVQIGKVTQDIQAIAADAAMAAALEVEEGSPVLRILRCYFDPKGRIFEISVSHHPGDRFAYAMHIDVEA